MSKSIYQKLHEIQKAVVGLTKDAKGNAGEYVSGNKILGIVRPMMDNLGLLLIPEVLNANFARQDYNTSKGSKSEMFCSLQIKFTWVDVETGETMYSLWASSGMNGFDKGYGSALTYGERYYLLKLFHIATDRDDVDAPRTVDEEMSLQAIIAQINSFTTQEQLNWAHEQYGGYWGKDKEYKAAIAKKQKEINNAKQNPTRQ